MIVHMVETSPSGSSASVVKSNRRACQGGRRNLEGSTLTGLAVGPC